MTLCITTEKSIPPYSTACAGGHLNVVRYLTEERHCDPLCKDVGNVTAVDVADSVSEIFY